MVLKFDFTERKQEIMTTRELKNKVSTSFKSYGHFNVEITYRAKQYTCTTTNTMAIDRISDDRITPDKYYVTEKQALMALWDECKLKNDLK